MKTIGIVGGIGSGKSSVARMLRELGAEVLDADRVGHAVLANDLEVQSSIRQRWGQDVFRPDGSVDRSAIARRVFAAGDVGKADRVFLEGLTHPRIRAALVARREELAATGTPVVIIDAALLFEAGWNEVCNFVIFVDAPREIRLDRARQRGWSEQQFAAREAAQLPVEEKRRRADIVLLNQGTEDELRQAVKAFWNQHVVG